MSLNIDKWSSHHSPQFYSGVVGAYDYDHHWDWICNARGSNKRMEFSKFLFFYEHIFKQLNFHEYHSLRGRYNDNAIVFCPCEPVFIKPVDLGPDYHYARRTQ